MKSRVLVTGASRGIGLEYVRQWLADGHRVFGLARDPEDSEGLRELSEGYPDNLVTVTCDVADGGSVEDARKRVGEETDGLEIVINNAGISGERGPVDTIDVDAVPPVLDVNALGPLRISQAFLDLLRAGHGTRRLVHMSSLMGSIADNQSGGSYAYRMSKAALNIAAVSLARDLAEEGIVSVVLHPGWVQTDMGGPNARVPTSEAVGALIRTIESLEIEQSGGFYDRDGEPLPW